MKLSIHARRVGGISFVVAASLLGVGAFEGNPYQLDSCQRGEKLRLSQQIKVPTRGVSIPQLFDRFGYKSMRLSDVEIAGPSFASAVVNHVALNFETTASGEDDFYEIVYFAEVEIAPDAPQNASGTLEVAFHYDYFKSGLVDIDGLEPGPALTAPVDHVSDFLETSAESKVRLSTANDRVIVELPLRTRSAALWTHGWSEPAWAAVTSLLGALWLFLLVQQRRVRIQERGTSEAPLDATVQP